MKPARTATRDARLRAAREGRGWSPEQAAEQEDASPRYPYATVERAERAERAVRAMRTAGMTVGQLQTAAGISRNSASKWRTILIAEGLDEPQEVAV